MFKHRDNIAHSPFTLDPQGSGTTMKAVSFAQQQQQQQKEENQEYNNINNEPTTAGKKRPRDIRGIEKFKQVIYGEKGLARFHAMITRNPILMYPPEGIDAARRRIQKKKEEEKKKQHNNNNNKENNLNKEKDDDDGLWEMFEERRAVEDAIVEVETNNNNNNTDNIPPETPVINGGIRDEELANYHHRQLDALLAIYYEFNHLTFMKLPINDTLQLLQRCGKEAVAHSLEFEMQLRMRRETRLKELQTLKEEEENLKKRQLEAQERVLEIELQAAEEENENLNYVDNDGIIS